MFQGKLYRRTIAATLLVIMLTNTLAPTVSYALTSGPTQPEATSFEPVDTTDMVSLQSGDFTYNIPLMEVPGPEGGYPLSLSYHAGIQPNEDASWVGLGWTLNPGAINRSVNGLPDDWKGVQGSNRGYWSGGNTTNANFGVNLGIAGTPFNVSFGLSYSNDTYKGVGIGYNIGLGATGGGGQSVNFGFGKGAYDNKPGFSAGLSQSIMSMGPVSFGISAETNFKSVNADAFGGVQFGQGTGGSMSFSSGSSSVSVGGLTTNFSSGEEHGVQTSTRGINVNLPVTNFLSFNLGFSKTRYWSDETTNKAGSGSLFYWGENLPNTNNYYDNYSLLEDPAEKDFVANPDPSVLQGGTYPDYDAYNVTAQGLGGSIRPYKMQGYLMGQPRKGTVGSTPNYDILTYPYPSYAPNFHHEVTGFRFINDFSNSYRQDYLPYSDITQDLVMAAHVPFDGQADFGNNDGLKGVWASDPDEKVRVALAGSKHIDIGLKINPVNCWGYNPAERYRTGMIKGFSITNESGVNYHYGLPAYSYNEETYQEKVNTQKGQYFNRGEKPGAYAYTWYLTTITGADFVDRNNNAIADEGDWGYWVNFEYGKWSNNYTWRNPSEGYQRDEDNAWQNCSMGKKEVYYLNAIRTRTHIALFEKDMRPDGKGAADNISNKLGGKEYDNDGRFGLNSAQSMKLSKIYLLNIADANVLNPYDGGFNPYYYNFDKPACSDCQLPNNVLEFSDLEVAGKANVESKALRVIDLVYDYSLCPKTKNSFRLSSPYLLDYYYGKLTLKQLNFRGRQGVSLLPATKFEYELSGNEVKSQAGVTMGSTYFTTSNGSFEIGDMINRSDGAFAGLITDKRLTGGNWNYTLANNSYTDAATITTNVVTTKNPPYNKDAYDEWGMYKGDVNATVLSNNENMGRTTTLASGKAADAWSLRKIISPLGDAITMKYESDTYKKPVIDNSNSFVMKGLSIESNNQTISFQLENYSSPVEPMPMPAVGSRFPRVLLMASMYDGFIGTRSKRSLAAQGGLTVTAVNGTTITGNLDVPITQVSNYTLVTGNIWVDQGTVNTDFYGGGLRVNSLTINHSIDNTSSSVLYNYNNMTGRSSGVTSYTPTLLDVYDAAAIFANPNNDHGFLEWDAWKYKTYLYKNVNSIYPLARELPPPGVLYEFVTISNQVKNPDEASARSAEGATRYQFEVFRDNMVNREEVNTIQVAPGNGANNVNTNYARNWVIRKFTASIGNVKKVTQLDKDGRKLNETTNHYLHDGLETLPFHEFMLQYKNLLDQYQQKYHYQGFLQERYFELKKVYLGVTNPYEPQGPSAYNRGTNVNGIKATMSAREEYPCIPTKTTVVNYVNGTNTTSEILSFDFYSGAVTKTVETDAYGNRFMTETVPAYTRYEAMGLKINNSNQKNMLSQTAATYLYRVNSSNEPTGLVSASVQTWGNTTPVLDKDGNVYTQNTGGTTGDVWRMQAAYSWRPVNKPYDGITPQDQFSDFVWNNPASSHANWKKTGGVTMYDVYSKELEDIDMSGNYAATRMTYNSKKTELTGEPANYYEMAYSGAEDEGVDQANNIFVKKADGVVTGNAAHTGVKSLQLGVSGKKGLVYSVNTSKLVSGRNYIAHVWVKPVSGTVSDVKLFYDINGAVKATASSANSSKTANGWTLVSLNINGADITAGQTLTVGCRNDHGAVEAYVDDLRFQPLVANTTAFVYDPFTGQLTYVLNSNNLYTAYEYDAAGRLLRTYVEKTGVGKIKAKEFQYNMAQALYVAPSVIYAKFDYKYAYPYEQQCERTYYYDVFIRFYSDPACTVSLNVSNLTLKYYGLEYNMPGANNNFEGTATIGATPVNSYYVGVAPLKYKNSCTLVQGHVDYQLQPGNYIVAPSTVPQVPMIYGKVVKTYVGSDYSHDGCSFEEYYSARLQFYSDAACTQDINVTWTQVQWFVGNKSGTVTVLGSAVNSVQLFTYEVLHRRDMCGTGVETDVPVYFTIVQ